MTPAGLDYVDTHYTPGPGAVVLPAEKYGVSDVMEMTNQRIGEWAKNKAAEKKQQREVTQKMLEGLKTKLGTPLDKDIPELLAESEALTNKAAEFIAQGKDPSNPQNYKEWAEIENMKNRLEQKSQGSNQHRAFILEEEKRMDALEQAGKPVDRKAGNANIARYHDLPYDERAKESGSLIKMKGFDGYEYLSELFGPKGPVKPGKISTVKKDENNPSLTYIEEVEGRDEDQVMQITKLALNSKPEYKDWVYDKFLKLKEEHPEAYQGYVDHAQSLVNDGHTVTADEVFASQTAEIAYNETTKDFGYQRESNKSLKYDPKDVIAFRAGIAAEERNKVGGAIYEKWKGVWSGNQKDWYKGDDGKLHSSVFNGNQWGSPYADPVTGTAVAVVLDMVDGGTDANGNAIRLIKTTKSAKDNPSNPYFPMVDMGQAMDQWIIGGSGELTNPAKASDVIQGTRVYGTKDGTYNKANGKFAIKPVKGTYGAPQATAAYQDLSSKQQKITELQNKLNQTDSKIPAYGEINTQLTALKKEKDDAKKEFIKKHVHNLKSAEEATKLSPGEFWTIDAGKTINRRK